mgnify:CR=1 FL=1
MKNMIMHSVMLLLLFTLSSLVAIGQPKGVVSGVVLEKGSSQPLPYVSVVVKSQDGGIIAGQITDDAGKFQLTNVPMGKHVLEIQFIGFQTVTQAVALSPRESSVTVGTVYLAEEATLLESVEVTADRATIEQKADRKIVNVGKDLASVGGTAADIMVNLPAVDVDQNGAISFRGNSNIRILVDGKPTNLDAGQLLQQIPASSIKQIELITNPSAKYNPEGMSGIINVILQKNSQLGLHATLSSDVTVGRKVRTSETVNLNYRKGAFNVYGSYAANQGITPVEGDLSRSTDDSREDWFSTLDRNMHLLKLGVDFDWSERTSLSMYAVQNPGKIRRFRSAAILFPNEPQSNFGQDYESLSDTRNSTVNFHIKHQFAQEGRSLELEVDHNRYRSDEAADFVFSNAMEADLEVVEKVDLNRENLTVNLDYVQQTFQNHTLEAGFEMRLQSADNRYETTNPNLRNADFDFERGIYAAYATLGRSVGKWSYQLGARLERFDTNGAFEESGEGEQEMKDQILSVYPSGYLRYTPDPTAQKDIFTLNFSRRVDRPGLTQLSPVRVWSSARITNVGNPSLVPQFTNSLELSYARQFVNGGLTMGAFVRDIHDEIIRFGFNDPSNPENIFFSYNNYGRNRSVGIELSGNYQLTDWWRFTSSFDMYIRRQRAEIASALTEVQSTLSNFRMNHSFQASDKLTFQLIGAYRGPNTNLQYTTLSVYFVNLGARYKVLKGKGTLNLRFNDIFRTQRFAFEGDRPVSQEGRFLFDSQTVYLGFTYQFGGPGKGSSARKKRDKRETRGDSF